MSEPSVLAVDFGGTHAACAVVSGRELLGCQTVLVPDSRLLAPLLERVSAVLGNLAGTVATCQGVAFSFCGIVDPMTGRVLSTPAGKYEDSRSLDLPAWCRNEFGLPFAIENDARMALLGERYAGAARGCDDVVMVTLGTGVGGAAMIGGRLLRGKHFQAGCLGGHLPVHFDGRLCVCGATGCVEAEASGWALPAICRNWEGYEQSALAAEPSLDFAALFRLAAGGDRVAIEVRDRCLAIWEAGLVGLIHAYDPEKIIVGGAVMGSAGQILPELRRRVARGSWTPWGEVEVCAAGLGNHAALLGAVPLLEGKC